MTPEQLAPDQRRRHLRWLLDSCRFWLTGLETDAPATDPEDWRELAAFVYFHDLDPLLHHLAGSDRLDLGERVPARVRQQWESAYYRNFVFNIELVDLVETFLDAAEREGLQARVFKGPVTIARGWFDPALRVMADVDLICRQRDLPRLAEIARILDFEAGPQTAVHHLALKHRTLPAALELHFQLYDVIAQPATLLERLWAEPAWVEVDGRKLPAPPPELALILDAGHLLQHDLQLNLRPFLDLSATLWRQRDTLDPELIDELLRTADLEPEYRSILGLLDRVLGLPVPTRLSGGGQAPPAALAGALEARLLAPDRLDRIGALAGPHRRGGAGSTLSYVLRRLLPPLEQLQAMSGSRSRTRALGAYPAHAAATVGRALRRWRSSGAGGAEASLKNDLFRRRR